MWKHLKKAAHVTYGIGMVLVGQAYVSATNKFDDLKSPTNGVNGDVNATTRINTKGLENSIFIPEPSDADRKWARKMKKAGSHTVQAELGQALEQGQNWRALYLVNRPYRHVSILGHATRGFSGNMGVGDGMHSAAKTDNVTGAYILLKFAEQVPTHISAGDDKVHDWMRDHEVFNVAIRGIQSAAAFNADKMTQLFVNTVGDFAKIYDRSLGNECFDSYVESAVTDMIVNKNTKQMQMLLDHGVRAETFVGACETTLQQSYHFGFKQLVTEETRQVFIDWALQNRLIDQPQADKFVAAGQAQTAAIVAAKADDSYYQNIVTGKQIRIQNPERNESMFTDKMVISSRIDETTVDAKIQSRDGEIAAKFNFAARTIKLGDNVMSLDDYKKQDAYAPAIVQYVEANWAEHQTLNRLPHRKP